MAITHIVGGGLAGLSAAVLVVAAGGRAVVYEASRYCGGRCRSFDDPVLGCRIDNGNHLMLSGNRSLRWYLATIGASDRLQVADRATFPMVDLLSGARGSLDLGVGRWPWPLLGRSGRPPGIRRRDLWRLGRIFKGKDDDTVADRVGRNCPLMRAVWEPLSLAVLNERPDSGSAAMLAAVLRETVLRGASASRPMVAKHSLGDTFIDPALAWLAANGGVVSTGIAITGLESDERPITDDRKAGGERITGLFAGRQRDRLAVEEEDSVILAVPPEQAVRLLPGLSVPASGEAIINIHFRREPSVGAVTSLPMILGVLGGTAQWIFPRPEVWSVTISAAGALVDQPGDALARTVWQDLIAALGLDPATPMPVNRLIKERRATVRQRPGDAANRPPVATSWLNLWLAGDWTAGALPATMESAVRSGRRAGVAALVPVST